jgi:hypothetical protein
VQTKHAASPEKRVCRTKKKQYQGVHYLQLRMLRIILYWQLSNKLRLDGLRIILYLQLSAHKPQEHRCVGSAS